MKPDRWDDAMRMQAGVSKASLRKAVLLRRSALAEDVIAETSRRIAGYLFETDTWKRADVLLCYSAVRSEADPAPIIRQAWTQGKPVYLPKTVGKDLYFLKYDPQTGLTAGAYGIPEPPEDAEAWDVRMRQNNAGKADPCGISPCTLVIVPGVVFSPEGWRIGYGGGYYDRFFARWEAQHAGENAAGRIVRCGIGYEFQISDEIIPEPHDVRMDEIITECGVRLINGNH